MFFFSLSTYFCFYSYQASHQLCCNYVLFLYSYFCYYSYQASRRRIPINSIVIMFFFLSTYFCFCSYQTSRRTFSCFLELDADSLWLLLSEVCQSHQLTPASPEFPVVKVNMSSQHVEPFTLIDDHRQVSQQWRTNNTCYPSVHKIYLKMYTGWN